MPKVLSIEKVDRKVQKCLTVSSDDGLFVINNGLVTHNCDSKIQTFFSKLRDRIDSRMKKNYISRFILDSSPNTLESPIDDWIWNVATKDPSIKIFSGARWKFFKDDFDINCYEDDGITIKEDWDYNFPMFKGGNGMSPHIIRSEVEYKNTDRLDVVWCPKTGAGVSMYDKAEMDPIEFLKDWAGIPSGTADRIFYQSKFIEDVFDNNLRNIYMSITAPAEEEPEHLIWNQIRDQFFNKVFKHTINSFKSRQRHFIKFFSSFCNY